MFTTELKKHLWIGYNERSETHRYCFEDKREASHLVARHVEVGQLVAYCRYQVGQTGAGGRTARAGRGWLKWKLKIKTFQNN